MNRKCHTNKSRVPESKPKMNFKIKIPEDVNDVSDETTAMKYTCHSGTTKLNESICTTNQLWPDTLLDGWGSLWIYFHLFVGSIALRSQCLVSLLFATIFREILFVRFSNSRRNKCTRTLDFVVRQILAMF